MVFNSMTAIFTILVLTWLVVITYLLLRALSNYNRLTHGVTTKTLSQILSEYVRQSQLTQEELKSIQDEFKALEKKSVHHVQKIGMVRFNPFSDTGGDQSISLAFLDGNDSGIVMTSLYGRTGVRWYVKTVKHGKGIEHELSKEEQAAIKSMVK